MEDVNTRDYKVSIANDEKRVQVTLDLPLDTVAGRRKLGRVVKKLEKLWQLSTEVAFLERGETEI